MAIRNITKINTLTPSETSHVNVSVTYETDVNIVTQTLSTNVERDPAAIALSTFIFNQEMHKRWVENVIYDYDDSNLKRNKRGIASNHIYHYFIEHNKISWRLSENLQIIREMNYQSVLHNPTHFMHENLDIKDGTVALIDIMVDGNYQRMLYLHGANNLHPDLETRLLGRTKGDKINCSIENYYGVYSEANIETFKYDELKEIAWEVGTTVLLRDERDYEFIGNILSIDEEQKIIYVNMNHPLSAIANSQRYNVVVEILAVRNATKDELQYGSALSWNF